MLMAYVSNSEWEGRLMQLHGFVGDGTRVQGVCGGCGVEARLESYFLKVGRAEMGGWARDVDVAIGLGRRERDVWAEVYGGAARFLERAFGEVWG